MKVYAPSLLRGSYPVMGYPSFILQQEIEGPYLTKLRNEQMELIKYYDIYERGAKFASEGSKGDYLPSQTRYKLARNLIDKEARFQFSKPPDYNVTMDYPEDVTMEQITGYRDDQTVYQSLVDKVLEDNNFSEKLVKAARDAFIAKRVAIILNFNHKGIVITVSPALEFIYEMDPTAPNQLKKLVTFWGTNDQASNAAEERIYKKKYYMHEDGYCHIVEEEYDGSGVLINTIEPDFATKFTYIPAFVVLNDGLTGDPDGESDIANVVDYESQYSKLANADQDSLRKGMNPIKYTIDMNPKTTKKLPTGPGAYWDLATDQGRVADGGQGQAGVLDTPMGYSEPLKTTLDRTKTTMYSQLDVPDISTESLKGVVPSGKTMKAIYWPLIMRVDEKMLSWAPALKGMMKAIIEGARLYPEFAKKYMGANRSLPANTDYTVTVNNNYPLPDDEQDEKTSDLSRVNAGTMSRKSFIQKWDNKTPVEADLELMQIQQEKMTLEHNVLPPTYGATNALLARYSEPEEVEEDILVEEAEVVTDAADPGTES